MSLAININRIKRILLADGWHKVIKDTFFIDSYEFVEEWIAEQEGKPYATNAVFNGGQDKMITSTGACWTEDNISNDADDDEREMYCPLTSILAISY